jgi:hypothetical protein
MLAASIIKTVILIALKMEAPSPSETSVNFYETKCRKTPEDSHLETNSIQKTLGDVGTGGNKISFIFIYLFVFCLKTLCQ